jgi:hypothetical protein
VRICDLLLGQPSGRARLDDRLDKVARQLGVELATWWEVDPELEALRTSATQVRDKVLDWADGPSSPVASLSMAAELLEGWVDATTANGVRWGTQSALVSALSHFPVLEAEREMHGSNRNAAVIGGCPLDPGTPSLRLAGIARPSFGCPRPS